MLNVLLAGTATALTFRRAVDKRKIATSEQSRPIVALRQDLASRTILILLFSTGLTSMAIEVVWIRQFTPYLGTVVYAFALILGSYLAATFAGSQVYRRWSRRHTTEGKLVWALLGFSILLPLITADPGIHIGRYPLEIGFQDSRKHRNCSSPPTMHSNSPTFCGSFLASVHSPRSWGL